jgi:hypothetical protein
VPHETEKEESVGITVQYRIKPCAVLAALELEPGHFAIAAVDDGGKLGQKTAKEKRGITAKCEQCGGRDGAQE